ncbi:MAG: ABC transporter permease [Clostridia bacterium]|nr:ABC transporter permease [Clostridia bacterium]MBR7141329.1 ABC transporter permease [Clostridia bacterium]
MRNKTFKTVGWIFIALMLAFVYLPIIILIIFSFAPTSKAIGNWANITWSADLYAELMQSEGILEAIKNTFILALTSSTLATIIGTVGAVGIHKLKRRPKAIVNGMSQITVVNAEIVTGAAFMLFFTLFPRELEGFPALIIAHTIITMPYVLLSVMPRLTQLNPNLYEAGLDLGAGPLRTLITVILPQLIPGMIAGFGLAFTLSLDDYVISKFINGDVQTISTMIYSATKKGIPAVWRAVSSLIFVVILVMLIIMNMAKRKKEDK